MPSISRRRSSKPTEWTVPEGDALRPATRLACASPPTYSYSSLNASTRPSAVPTMNVASDDGGALIAEVIAFCGPCDEMAGLAQ